MIVIHYSSKIPVDVSVSEEIEKKCGIYSSGSKHSIKKSAVKISANPM